MKALKIYWGNSIIMKYFGLAIIFTAFLCLSACSHYHERILTGHFSGLIYVNEDSDDEIFIDFALVNNNQVDQVDYIVYFDFETSKQLEPLSFQGNSSLSESVITAEGKIMIDIIHSADNEHFSIVGNDYDDQNGVVFLIRFNDDGCLIRQLSYSTEYISSKIGNDDVFTGMDSVTEFILAFAKEQTDIWDFINSKNN